MFSIEASIRAVFCCVDDLLMEITQIDPTRHRRFASALAASEGLTIAVVAEFLGMDADKEIESYFHCHGLKLFPNFGSCFSLIT